MKAFVYLTTIIEIQVYSHRTVIYLFQSTRLHVSNMHYASFSLQNISHDWNGIQTRPSVIHVSLTCQFSNAESYEYFMDREACHSSANFVNPRIRSALSLYCSYGSQLLHFSVRYWQSFNVQNHYSVTIFVKISSQITLRVFICVS